MVATTRKLDCEYSLSIASTREFDCEYSRVFSSLALASFHSRVGKASLACARSHSRLALACDIASNASHSHSFVNLRLSGTVLSVYKLHIGVHVHICKRVMVHNCYVALHTC